MHRISALACLITLQLSCTQHSRHPTASIQPESTVGRQSVTRVQAKDYLAVAAHPEAAAAGAAILDRGGSAVDAAIAMQATLSLVEPQSSGIGGGAFLLVYRASDRKIFSYDGRATAPSKATASMFMNGDTPQPFFDAVLSGRSVGVPGVLRMLEKAHEVHGTLAWSTLFERAISLSQNGFELSPRLHALLERFPRLSERPGSREYFFDVNGRPYPIGHRLTNQPLADTLKTIATTGADALYQGPIAQDIIAALQSDPIPGLLSLEDLADYKALERPPVCRTYRSYRVCGMGPPTSGGVTVLQILGILEQISPAFPNQNPDTDLSAHLFAEASRLAYADRARYLADSDFVPVPVDDLLSTSYLAERAALISASQTMGKAQPGRVPRTSKGPIPPADASPEFNSTSHLVAIDRAGNAVSMTSSIEMAFGSGLMVRGFLLNNQLTDFSFVSEKDGQLVANRVQANKRPRSSMAPMIVLRPDNSLQMLIGSPGGSRIINYVARTLVQVLHQGRHIQHALESPHVVNRNGLTEVETVPSGQDLIAPLIEGLKSRGHHIKRRDLNSGLHGIWIDASGRYHAGVDPRREGLAVGQ